MRTPTRKTITLAWGAVSLGLLGLISCSGGDQPTSGFGDTGGSGGDGGKGGGSPAGGPSSGMGGLVSWTASGGAGGAAPTCTPLGPTDDVDQDGYTPNDGDCDDCDANQNPNAIEVATPMGGDPHDENCDGVV